MLNKRERALVTILPWFVLLAAAAVFLFFQQGERAALQAEAVGLEAQVPKLAAKLGDAGALEKQRQGLQAQVDQVRGRLYAAGEMDIFRFAILIRDMLQADGLRISRYQSVDVPGQNAYEFAVSGSALDLARFLQQVYQSKKHWPVSHIAISAKSGDGTVDATFRIGYESLD